MHDVVVNNQVYLSKVLGVRSSRFFLMAPIFLLGSFFHMKVLIKLLKVFFIPSNYTKIVFILHININMYVLFYN